MLKRRKQKSWFARHPLRAGALILIVGSVFYSLSQLQLAQPANIFVVAEPLVYGETTITGTVLKDAVAGQPASYYLTTAQGQVVLLDLTSLDYVLNTEVEVRGYLYPADSVNLNPYLEVSRITVQ